MMFCTHADGEIKIPEIFDEKDEYWWSYIKLPLFTPYFLVVCSPADKSTDGCSSTFFFTTIDEVKMVYSDAMVDILSVNLVSPGYMNGSGTWQMDELRTVYRGLEMGEPDHRQFGFIYSVASGSRYLQCGVATSESELEDLQVIFDLSTNPTP